MTLWVGAHEGKFHFAKFTGHRHFGSRDIMVFICHLTLQDHMIIALYDFKFKSPSVLSHHPTTFGGHMHFGSGNIVVLVYHMI